MSRGKPELTEVLKPAVRVLILQEVRLLQFEESLAPPFILNDIARSIQEAKREISGYLRLMSRDERDRLLRRMLRQVLDEEIDRTVKWRETRCLRCVNIRYVDRAGTRHGVFPLGENRAVSVGCVVNRQSPGIHCKRFTERLTAVSLEDHLRGVALLYELREMFDQMTQLWEEYLTK